MAAECWRSNGPLAPGPNYKNTAAVAVWRKQFPPDRYFERFGFRIGYEPIIATTKSGALAGGGKHTFAVLPDWALLVLLVMLPGIAIVKARRRRKDARTANGLCPVCHYDLRATPDRCPECGTVPKAAV